MKTNWHILSLVLILLACEERIGVELPSEDVNLIAVEAVLTNENTNQKVKLRLPYQQLNGSPTPASGALVTVQEGNGVIYTFLEDSGNPGVYVSPAFQAAVNTEYTLIVQYKGREVRAKDSSIPVEPLEPLQYQNSDDRYELILDESGQSPYYIDHNISWKGTAACTTSTGCEGRVVFYDLKNIDVNEIYKPAKKQFTFPSGTTVIRKKYSVSPAYRNFLRAILSETEWRGSVFDVDRANATTNLSKGAIGFFAITSVISDITVIK